jgi:hypothetical protein
VGSGEVDGWKEEETNRPEGKGIRLSSEIQTEVKPLQPVHGLACLTQRIKSNSFHWKKRKSIFFSWALPN